MKKTGKSEAVPESCLCSAALMGVPSSAGAWWLHCVPCCPKDAREYIFISFLPGFYKHS